MSKMKKFVEDVVLILQGDNAKATGEKILRQADSALKTQIANLTGDTIGLEDEVEDAKEKLRLARLNNGNLIANRTNYVANLLVAKNALTIAETNLEEHKAKLEFLEAEYAALSK